ncbi:sporulation histidine kinase inhibitor Sda [Bacillus dakarensis]|nr:sporulation histidine kinase inhibitor Sda [Bacillus dakarensis]
MKDLPDEILIACYLKAVELKLDKAFIELLFNEINSRNIQHFLEE